VCKGNTLPFFFNAKVKIGKHLSPEFKVNRGLRLLLNVMLEIAIMRSKVETFDECCQIMAYADEVVIKGRMLHYVKEVIICCILCFGGFLSV
jgi:hypothetical protein